MSSHLATAGRTVRLPNRPRPPRPPGRTGRLARMWRDCGADGRRYRRAPVGTRWLTPADDLVSELVLHTPDRRTGDTVVLSEKVAVLLLGRTVSAESLEPGPLAWVLARLLRRRPASAEHDLGAGRPPYERVQLPPLAAREAEWLCRCLERALGTGVGIVTHGRTVRATSPMSLPAPGLAPGAG